MAAVTSGQDATKSATGNRTVRFCSYCGTKLDESARFCKSCGEATFGAAHSAPETETRSKTAFEDPLAGNPTERKTVYEGYVHKCPNCGEVLKSFEANCPACSYEIRAARVTSSVRELSLKLEAIEANREDVQKRIGNKKVSTYERRQIKEEVESKTDDQKATLISTFPIPTTKEDLYEFIILAESHMHNGSNTTISNAWKAKFKQAYKKAEFAFANDSDFRKVKDIYEGNKERTKKIVWISLVSSIGGLALLILIIVGLVALSNNSKITQEVDRLEAIIAEVETSLVDGEYELALSDAESISFKLNYGEQKRQWIYIRKQLLDKVIKTAESNGIALEYSLKAVGVNYESLIGRDFQSVSSFLKERGFINIVALPVADLGGSWWDDDGGFDGEITEISINGETDFLAESSYRPDAMIAISYRTIKDKSNNTGSGGE